MRKTGELMMHFIRYLMRQALLALSADRLHFQRVALPRSIAYCLCFDPAIQRWHLMCIPDSFPYRLQWYADLESVQQARDILQRSVGKETRLRQVPPSEIVARRRPLVASAS